MYFNIKCKCKSPGPKNEFERSLVFETGEFERPKFDCIFLSLDEAEFYSFLLFVKILQGIKMFEHL